MKIIRNTKTETNELEVAVLAWRATRNAAAEAADAEKDAKKRVEKLLVEQQLKRAVVRVGDRKYSASYVTPLPKVVIDEEGLLSTLKASEVTKVTNKVLDRKKLEEVMDKDENFSAKAQEFMTLKDSTPYLRYTEGANDDLESNEEDQE